MKLNKMGLLRYLAWLWWALLALMQPTQSIAQLIAPSVSAELPIADVHFHYMVFMTPHELQDRMDKNNVRWIVSAGAQGNPAAGKNPWMRDSDLKPQLKERFLAAAGGYETYWGEKEHGNDFFTDAANPKAVAALKRMDELLRAGDRVIVETFPNAESTSMDPMRRRRLPTNAPFFKEALQLAIRHDIPLPMHMQWHPESVAQLGSLLTEFPSGRVLLSHCGSVTSAVDIRQFFRQYSNVYCDLGFRGMPQLAHDRLRDQGRTVYWPASFMRKAGIDADWLRLLEEYPDRFMLAIDDVISWEQYDEIVASIRTGVLAGLTQATAEKVAYRNAMKVFRLKQATPSGTNPMSH